MQEKESIMDVQCKLKIISLNKFMITRITVLDHSERLAMLNSYPHYRICNLHLATIKDNYIPSYLHCLKILGRSTTDKHVLFVKFSTYSAYSCPLYSVIIYLFM